MIKTNKKNLNSVSIIGLGYVGLPLAIRFLNEGFLVYGIDTDSHKIKSLKCGKSYIKNINLDSVKDKINSNFVLSEKYENVNKSEAIIIAVPTPLDDSKTPDLSYVLSSLNGIKPYIKKNQLISLESTTYPGTTREFVKPLIDNKGWKAGKDFFIVFSPEREDPGNSKFNTQNTPKLVGGITKNCTKKGYELYSKVIDKVVPVSSAEIAEFAKILENVYRCVNISLMNELKIVADKMQLDIFEIVEAAGTKPFGFSKFYPGPGLGGHCIPIDPFYLSYSARKHGLETKFVDLSGEVNQAAPDFVVSKIALALNSHIKSIKKSKILLMGAAYKKNIDDARESPFFKIFKTLKQFGAVLSYYDPYVPLLSIDNKKIKSEDSKNLTMKNYDCIVLITDHDIFDYEEILRLSKLIVDCRGRFPYTSKKVFQG